MAGKGIAKTYRKQRASLIWALAAVTVLMIVLLALPSKETVEKPEEIDLFSIKTEKVDSFSIHFEDGKTLNMEKLNNTWFFADTHVEADFERAHLTATYLSYMFADHLVTENATDLAEYGLDMPSSWATFSTNEGDNHRITFGDVTPDKASVYIRIDEESIIYTVDTVSYDIIMGDAKALASVDMQSLDGENLVEIDITNDYGESIVLLKQDGLWLMTQPYVIAASPYALGDYATQMPELILGDYIADRAESEHGFGGKVSRLKFVDANGKSVALELGAEAGNNYRYCRIDGGDAVYTIYEAHTLLTRIPMIDFANPVIWPVTTENTKKLSITYEDQTLALAESDSNWTVGGLSASKEVVDYFFGQLSAITLIEIIDSIEEENAAGSIAWKLADSSTVSYPIYPYKSSFLAVKQPNGVILTFNKQAFEALLALINQAISS